jgi:hypothetical protein
LCDLEHPGSLLLQVSDDLQRLALETDRRFGG